MPRYLGLSILLFGGWVGFVQQAWAAGQPQSLEALSAQLSALQTNLDHVWMMTTGGLIFLMQIGFMLVESGLVRSKNSINVAQKNLADFALSLACFGALGFMVMFGATVYGLFGFDHGLIAFDRLDKNTYAFFIFQAFFCGTSATIMSGAIAERMRLSAYLMTIPVITVVIYQVFGHWAWGDALVDRNGTLLAGWGFIDFAGSTVVHSVGAWVGLAALLIIGPRIGRFDEHGRPIRIQGHSVVLATVGVFLLWIGWMGFNGGSTLTSSGDASHIIANTMIAGAMGGVGGFVLGCLRDAEFQPYRMMNGVLGGLVAVTAGCDLVSSWGAVVLGLTGSWVALAGMELLEKRGIDDAVGAIPVHGFAGAWGTVALALIAPQDALPLGSRIDQLLVQSAGVALAFCWAFGTAFIAFKIIDRLWGLRITVADEVAGLNQAEHGATLGTGELQKLLLDLTAGEASFSQRLHVEPGDEAAELAILFNEHMGRLEAEQIRQRLAEERHAASLQAALEQEKAMSAMQRNFVSMASHEFRTPLTIIDCNAQKIERRITKMAPGDVVGRVKKVRGAVKRMLSLMESTLAAAKMESGKIEIAPKPIDVRALLLDCCEVQQELATGHRIVVDHQGLPDEMVADPTSLTQILTNLLSNAVKYSPDADLVEVRGWQEAGDVLISVKDHGLGIDEKEQDQMFTRFFRAKTSIGIPGTGIGLNLAQMLAAEHGGAITLASTKGEGSIFTLRLPLTARPPMTVAADQETPQAVCPTS